MTINLSSLLPDTLSDEAAYQVVKLFSELAIALENYYAASMRKYPEKIQSREEFSDAFIDWEKGDPF